MSQEPMNAKWQARIAQLRSLPQGVVHQRPMSLHKLRVVMQGEQLQLRFYGADSPEIISRLNVSNPLELVSLYAQAMMLTLLWQEKPARIYVLGFGAGRVPMVFHHYFPDLIIEATELDKDVVEVACEYFCVELDHRLNVVVEDGRRYLEKRKSSVPYEIMLIDASKGTGSSPFPLATQEFYQLCKQHLSVDGVLSVNMLPNDVLYKEKVNTIAAAFRNVYVLHTDWGNSVFFATDADPKSAEEFMSRATRIFERHKFVFPFMDHLSRLRQIVWNSQLLEPAYRGEILSDKKPPSLLPLPVSAMGRTAQDDFCPCGSGKKHKECHGSLWNILQHAAKKFIPK